MRPGKKHSEEEAQDQVKADSFGLDDLVTINSITGYVDFIGGDIIVLIDQNDERHYIPHTAITEACVLKPFIKDSLCRFSIPPKR